jgi:enamine deaminase RidA (YjgF/YER057c/UK114 family)
LAAQRQIATWAAKTELHPGDKRSCGGSCLGQTVRMPQRLRVSSGSPFEPVIGFSRALRVGDRVLVAGTGPVWPDGSCPDDPYLQARRAFEIGTDAMAEAGANIADVVRTRMYLTSVADSDAVGRAHGELFGSVRPVATMLVVAGFLDPRWRVEIEMEAHTTV